MKSGKLTEVWTHLERQHHLHFKCMATSSSMYEQTDCLTNWRANNFQLQYAMILVDSNFDNLQKVIQTWAKNIYCVSL